jgi:hypothetical protein
VGYLRRPPRVTIHHSTSKMVPPPNTVAALHARDAAATHAMPPSTATATSNRPRGNVSSHPRFPTPYPDTPASIHPTSGKKRNSPKFTVANGSSTHRQALNDRPCCSPSAPKRSDLVLFVAPLCIKGLRLVTARVPEKSSPIGPGLNQLPLLRVLRSSATERSRKLTAYGAMLDPPTAGAPSSPRKSLFWGP